ncbi:MAG: phage/plasmid primase, P4 family [Christensenellales bacterium]
MYDYDYDKIPEELKTLSQWVCWRAEPDETRPGKIRKVPVNAMTGSNAQSNNPETWCGFGQAVAASPRFNGIGLMLGNGIFGVDLDGCEAAIEDYKHGIDENIVGEFIHTLKSYTEYSVSGKGIHILCKGALPPGGRRKGSVEMYDSQRFFIVTGNKCAEYQGVRDCTDAIKTLHERYIGGGQAPTTGIKPALPLNLSDAEIIKLAEASAKGAFFKDLWSGNFTPYHNSQSEADLALCNILAFWTSRDALLMDRLFRQSGLMRPKWLEKHGGKTYGQATIDKAVRDCSEVYTPRAEFAVHIGVAEPEHPKPYKAYTFDDTGNAQRLYERFEGFILHNYTAKAWMYFDGRCWRQDDDGQSKRMADEIAEEMRHGLQDYLSHLMPGEDVDDAKKRYLAHVKYIRSSKGKIAMLKETEHLCRVKAMDFDRHSYKLSVMNGTLNLVTGELLPFDRADLISKIAPCEYTDKRDTPRWTAFLREIFKGDDELIRFVQKSVGYSLTGSTEEHCAFFCYGTGRNGKSTFLDVISEMMGDYAVNIQPETIMAKTNQGSGPTSDVARMKGARFITTVEPNEGARLNEGLLKQLTGGDKVTASKKYENEFEFMPEFKLWMGTNHKPTIRGTDLGIWSRIRLIPFDVRIPEEKIDRQLKHKLREELPGILAWAVDGCLMWRREGLKQPKSVLDASKEYRSEMDVLAAFTDACCLSHGEVDAGELFRAYIEWAKEGNEYEMSSTKFGREMGKRYERRVYLGKKIYIGVSLPTKAVSGFRVRM